jgi:hypothetical protein
MTIPTYTWKPAAGTDIANIVEMAQTHFQSEIDTVFNPDPVAYSRNVTMAVVRQFYIPHSELISVAIDNNTNELIAYTWAVPNECAPWSDDRMVVIRMAHLKLDLSTRLRVSLVKDMLQIWENFALFTNTPIICSTTMRHDQSGFLKLHERAGYSIRGSYAYKRLT